MTTLLQLQHPEHGRRVGLVREPLIVLLNASIRSTYQLFQEIIEGNQDVKTSVTKLLTGETLEYNPIYELKQDWRIVPPIDCPDDPMKCMVSGTGLTHKASASNRQKMHESEKEQQLTDSMKMYLLGEAGGKPADDAIGVQPEWFYKGNGSILKGHGEPLVVPSFADDGGDEPEVAGIYLVSSQGIPFRIGFVQGNEFSDHVMEQKNYLYLAPSKIRTCSIGPELVLDISFESLPGTVNLFRKGQAYWSKAVHTGEEAMAHSLSNLEYHHFKYDQHRIPGQLHVHFLGADAFSFGAGIKLQHEDIMEVSFQKMGRPLRNPIHIDETQERMVKIPVLK